MKKIYFLSDMHLGSPTFAEPLEVEHRVVRFLDSIKDDCAELYLVGDVIDFWFEYKYVVPRGFTRFLGKLGEFHDAGIPVHWWTGNHDIWIFDYIPQETGAIIHRAGEEIVLRGKKLYIAHGDGLGSDSRSLRFMEGFFRNRVCQRLFASIHPRWTMAFAHRWSAHSRLTGGRFPDFQGEAKEHLVIFAKQYLRQHPDIDYFIFGHRHIMLDLMLTHSNRLLILGDWIQHFSYAVMDDEGEILLSQFESDSEQ